MARIPVMNIGRAQPGRLRSSPARVGTSVMGHALTDLSRVMVSTGALLARQREQQIAKAHQSESIKFWGDLEANSLEISLEARSRVGERALVDKEGNADPVTDWAMKGYDEASTALIEKLSPEVRADVEARLPMERARFELPIAAHQATEDSKVAHQRLDSYMALAGDAMVGLAGDGEKMEGEMARIEERFSKFATTYGWTKEQSDEYMTTWYDKWIGKSVRALMKGKHYVQARALYEEFAGAEDVKERPMMLEATKADLRVDLDGGEFKAEALKVVNEAVAGLTRPLIADEVEKARALTNGIKDTDQRDYAQKELQQLITQMRGVDEENRQKDLNSWADQLRAGTATYGDIPPTQTGRYTYNEDNALQAIEAQHRLGRAPQYDEAKANYMYYMRPDGQGGERLATPREMADYNVWLLTPYADPDEIQSFFKESNKWEQHLDSGDGAAAQYGSDMKMFEATYASSSSEAPSLAAGSKTRKLLLGAEFQRRVRMEMDRLEVKQLSPDAKQVIADGMQLEIFEGEPKFLQSIGFDRKVVHSGAAADFGEEQKSFLRTKRDIGDLSKDAYTELASLTKQFVGHEPTFEEIKNYVGRYDAWVLPADQFNAVHDLLNPNIEPVPPPSAREIVRVAAPIGGRPITITPAQEDVARGVLRYKYENTEPTDTQIREQALQIISQKAAESGIPVEWAVDIGGFDASGSEAFRRFDALYPYIGAEEAFGRSGVPVGLRTKVMELLEVKVSD